MSRFKTFASSDWNLFVWSDEHWRVSEVADFGTWQWANRGACINDPDPDGWFEPEASLDRERLAAICGGCEVIEKCLDHALRHNERGWWGGTSRAERNQMQGRYVSG